MDDDDQDSPIAVYTNSGELLPAQKRVEIISVPGEIPVLRVDFFIDNINVCLSGGRQRRPVYEATSMGDDSRKFR